jgi:hypothetical protein
MTVLDPTTSLGKIRLRIGDWHDLVILPDSVIQSALDDCQAMSLVLLLSAHSTSSLPSQQRRTGSWRNLKRGPASSSINYVEFLR